MRQRCSFWVSRNKWYSVNKRLLRHSTQVGQCRLEKNVEATSVAEGPSKAAFGSRQARQHLGRHPNGRREYVCVQSIQERCCAFKMAPHRPIFALPHFHAGRCQQDEGLQESPIFRSAANVLPEWLPSLMRLPIVAIVEKIHTPQKLLWRARPAPRKGLIGCAEAVAIWVPYWMRKSTTWQVRIFRKPTIWETPRLLCFWKPEVRQLTS